MTSSLDHLADLPDSFRYSEALDHMSERHLHQLIERGAVIAIARGLYRKSGTIGDDNLVEIATRSPRATLCLRTALAHHELTDDIPAEIDVAIPRGSWTPRTTAPARWRHFDPSTFDIGRTALDIGCGRTLGIYSPERSIIDAFRLRHHEGSDLANEALKRWLRKGGQPSDLLMLAQSFPRTQTTLRRTLEILL